MTFAGDFLFLKLYQNFISALYTLHNKVLYSSQYKSTPMKKRSGRKKKDREKISEFKKNYPWAFKIARRIKERGFKL